MARCTCTCRPCMCNCCLTKVTCLACCGRENPASVMAGIMDRNSACVALIPAGYGIVIHKALVLTTHEYVSDSKEALHGEVLLNYGNHEAHHSPCLASKTKEARGLALPPTKPAMTPRTKHGLESVSETESKVASRAGTPPSTPERTHTHKFLPSRIFMTNQGLDLTLLACNPVPPEMTPLGLGQARTTRSMDLGRRVYILGRTRAGDTHSPLIIGKGRVFEVDTIFVKFATTTENWVPGSAGFDERGNFAFIVCNPKPPASPLPGSKKRPVRPYKNTIEHMGVLVEGVRRWITQHWEGGDFDQLVPALGKQAPSMEPLADEYASRTQPIRIKQKWSDDYNTAPMYTELALFMDVYNRLAALRRECTKLEKERKYQERDRLHSISREWLTEGANAEHLSMSSDKFAKDTPDFFAFMLSNKLLTSPRVSRGLHSREEQDIL